MGGAKMKITNIVVRTGRTMPHPHIGYANLRTDITMNAELIDGEDAEACIRELQIKANAAVDTDMQRMIEACEIRARARERFEPDTEDERPY
jgi:hypothetical protein